FVRHEPFHPRWGWVKKAVDAGEDPRALLRDDATVRLGVGKNQVRSIRFWGHATKSLSHAANPASPRLPLSKPSRLGHALFGKGGWDPFTEHPGSLWLLHWLLLAPKCDLPVWWLAFNEFGAIEFTDEQLHTFVEDQLEATSGWKEVQQGTVAKDVSCMLRTYASAKPGKGKRQPFEDTVDAPFRELGLLRCVDASTRTFRFVLGGKPTLPSSIALYACLDFLARTGATGKTATVSRLATEAGGPGRVFKLTESDLTDLLSTAAALHPDVVKLARPAGVTQIGFEGSAAAAATEVLASHYSRVGFGQGPADPHLLAADGADEPYAVPGQFVFGARTGLRLDASEPDDILDRVDFAQDRVDAGLKA
ncbi:MAG: DUF4007 family protein, partial [Myxococcales bacterium]|nr:DUF4007 family protein [Myxococcales bacterium]